MRKWILSIIGFCALLTGYSQTPLAPPLPSGSTYYKGMIVSQRGIGVIGCDNTEFLLADGSGCASALGSVSEIIPGTNISCTPDVSGKCIGSVTVSASGGIVPSNASFVFTGNSANDDDSNAIEPTFALTSFTCGSGSCVVVNSGNNGLVAGDWVNMRFSSAWLSTFAAPANTALATGYTLFQVPLTGLGSTSFRFQFSGSGSCSVTCGNAAKATYNLPFNTTAQGSLKGIGSTSVVIPSPVTLQELNTDYVTLLHPLSEAVTGTPTYFVIGQEENDIASTGAGCNSAATIEAALQSLWAKIHTDNSLVVEWSSNAFNYNQAGIGSCSSGYQIFVQVEQWLANQGPSTCNVNAGKCWDLFADVGRVVNDPTNSSLVASNGGFGLGGVNLASSIISNVISTGVSNPQDKRSTYFGAGPSQGNAANGFIHVPAADAIFYDQWWDAAMTTQIFTIRTSLGYKGVLINGGGDLNPFQVTGSNIHGIATLIGTDSGSAFAPLLTVLAPNSSSTANINIAVGKELSINNSAVFGFNYQNFGSTSNTLSIGLYNANGLKIDGSGNVIIGGISSSTSPICPNGTNGALTTVGCANAPASTAALKDCLSVSCAGGSTYTSGASYTNSSGHSVWEFVSMTVTGVCTGYAATISYTVDTLSFAGNGVYNDCAGAATVSFLVPAGSTFSVTAATASGSGGTPAITTWAESPNGQ